MTVSVIGAGRFYHLVCHLPRNLEHDVKKEKRNVAVECRSVGGANEREQIREKGGPLIEVGTQKEESQRVREFVSED